MSLWLAFALGELFGLALGFALGYLKWKAQ